jgi:hypothetical protein
VSIKYKCIWVLEMPRKIVKESFRSQCGSDLSQADIDQLANEFFAERPHLMEEKERPFGMLVEVHHPKPCIRYAFSRSKSTESSENVLGHPAIWHKDHSCFISEDAFIQTNAGGGHALPVSVYKFLRLGLHQCSEDNPESVSSIREHMKVQFPGNHICAAGESG